MRTYCELAAIAGVCSQLGLSRDEFLQLPDHIALELLAIHEERIAWMHALKDQ